MQIPSSPTGGIHAHWVSASLVTGYGPEPAGMESPRTMSIQKSPAVRQIQPMGLWGRLEAIRAPTIGKARKGKKSTKPPRALAVPQSLEGCVAGASDKDRTVSVQPPTNMATETAASDQASQGQRGYSSHRLLVSVPLSLLAQHHSTGRPSPKRYGDRYEVER